MATRTPPASDLSRNRLRQVSHWIRNDLDPVVAREGPEALRADDVLVLHDIFQSLRTSSSITALDLRATGIHRAVMEISGIATRWPGRLADDCDKLISLWNAKFGRLEELHPFLYGRGGRLEGIASIEETSKPALLRRWQNTCPDRISPKRAHRRGDLGFYPGSWWINPLFACHAGIIDVDTVDGGICHDKYGAYAIVLVEGGELDAPTESTLTYRCGKDDRGKFRLTAATPRSREPVRVLRSHSVNSIWGPKAGVRYEGLYLVKGWAVHQPKAVATSAGQKVRLGDMYYDVHLERCDPVSMDEVAKYPTADELDDYSEYKRLRKVHRDIRHNATVSPPDVNKLLSGPLKIAPVIPASLGTKSLRVSPAASRTTTFTAPPKTPPRRPSPSRVVVNTAHGTNVFEEMVATTRSTTNLELSAIARSELPPAHSPPSKGPASIASTSKSHLSDIKDVAPWTDYDLPNLTPVAGDLSSTRRPTFRSSGETNPHDLASDQYGSPTPMNRRETRKKSKGPHNVVLRPSSSSQNLKKEYRKSVFVRSRNPMAKLFDGAEDSVSKTVDYFTFKRSRAASTSPKRSAPALRRRARASSSGDTPQPISPVPVKPMRLNSLWLFERRDAVAFPFFHFMPPPTPVMNTGAERMFRGKSHDDPFTEELPAQPAESLPVSLKDFIAQPPSQNSDSTPSPYSPGPAQVAFPYGETTSNVSARRARAASRLKKIVRNLEELEIKVAFRDPFASPSNKSGKDRSESPSTAPDVVS